MSPAPASPPVGGLPAIGQGGGFGYGWGTAWGGVLGTPPLPVVPFFPVLENPSFEAPDPSQLAGLAASWVWSTSTSWRFARYGDSAHDSFELASVAFDLIAAVYGLTIPAPDDEEEFDAGWPVDGYLEELSLTVAAEFGQSAFSGAVAVADGFEGGWTNEPFAFDLSGAVAMLFDGDTAPADTFDAPVWWPGYTDTFVGIAMTFGGGGTSEVFTLVPDAPLNVSPPSTITTALTAVGTPIRLFSAVDGQSILPTGLNDRTTYYVVSPGNQLATTVGGTPQTFSDVGSGANYVRFDMTVAWGGRDGDSSGSDP